MAGSPGERGRASRSRVDGGQELRFVDSTATFILARKSFNYFDAPNRAEVILGRPIATTRLPGIQRELSVYAALAMGPRGEPNPPTTHLLVGEPGQDQLPVNQRKYTFVRLSTQNSRDFNFSGESAQIPSLFATDDTVRVELRRDQPGHLFVRNLSLREEVQLSVPAQEPLLAAEQRAAIPLDRFPLSKLFGVHVVKGSYAFHYVTEQERTLKEQVKRVWMTVAKEFSLEPSDFPVKMVNFWAEKRPEADLDRLEPRDLRRENRYRRYSTVQELYDQPHPVLAHAGDASNFDRDYINVSLYRDGRVEDATLSHELVHSYGTRHGIPFKDNYASITVEGIACAAQTVFEGYQPLSREDLASFSQFASLLSGSKGPRIGVSEPDLYTLPNRILHLYLLKTDGFPKIAELMTNMGPNRSISRERMLAAYEITYGASVERLMVDARAWYEGEVRSRGN